MVKNVIVFSIMATIYLVALCALFVHANLNQTLSVCVDPIVYVKPDRSARENNELIKLSFKDGYWGRVVFTECTS